MLRVVLSGKSPVNWLDGIQSNLQEPVEFIRLPDITDEAQVQAALANADVLVGQWPPSANPDCTLRMVHATGAGVDHFNQSTFPTRAFLCNVFEHEQAIAEYIFMTLLALRRNLVSINEKMRQGDWGFGESGAKPVKDIAGLTVGVIGFGRIAQALIQPVKAFRMKMIAIRSRETQGSPPEGVEFLGGPKDLPRLLSQSDVVVVAAPHTEQTRGLIGEREFAQMKPSACLINVGRAPVVDEAALYQALKSARIAGAAIDVWYNYPTGTERCLPSNYPIHELPNVIMTPHHSGSSEQTYARRKAEIAHNIDRLARGERPINVVWEPIQS